MDLKLYLRRNRVYLKVKIKNLADEARTIRQETTKACKQKDYPLVNGLTEHRKGIVRGEARCSLAAYAFLRNRPKPHKIHKDDFKRITQIVEKFGCTRWFSQVGNEDQAKRLQDWLKGK